MPTSLLWYWDSACLGCVLVHINPAVSESYSFLKHQAAVRFRVNCHLLYAQASLLRIVQCTDL